jgi:hypothetical protein
VKAAFHSNVAEVPKQYEPEAAGPTGCDLCKTELANWTASFPAKPLVVTCPNDGRGKYLKEHSIHPSDEVPDEDLVLLSGMGTLQLFLSVYAFLNPFLSRLY